MLRSIEVVGNSCEEPLSRVSGLESAYTTSTGRCRYCNVMAAPGHDRRFDRCPWLGRSWEAQAAVVISKWRVATSITRSSPGWRNG